jgi:hypothetical protein
LAVEKEFTTFVIEIPIIENSELQNTDDKAAS